MDYNNFIIEFTKKHSILLNKFIKIYENTNKPRYVFVQTIHGIFEVTQEYLLDGNVPKIVDALDKNAFFKSLSIEHHGDKFTYDLVNYINCKTRLQIGCKKHGTIFEQIFHNHFKYDTGCKICKSENVIKSGIFKRSHLNQRLPYNDFLIKANEIHNNKYIYADEPLNFKRHSDIEYTCSYHGLVKQSAHNHLNGVGCPICGKGQSKSEIDITQILQENGVNNIVCNQRFEKIEIDILLEDYNIGIEHDGLYYHSEIFKPNDFHLNKTKFFENRDIQIIHLFEDEYNHKKNVVINNILAKCNLSNGQKVYGRQTIIQTVSKEETNEFLNLYHLNSIDEYDISLGAYYNGVLVSVMTFRKIRENIFNLFQYANNFNYVPIGVFSKILKYFILNYNLDTVSSIVDRRWFNEKNIFSLLGFKLVHTTEPNYYYVGTNKLHKHDKNKFTVDYLKENYPTADFTLEYDDLMKSIGFYRLYDCGSFIYKLDCTNFKKFTLQNYKKEEITINDKKIVVKPFFKLSKIKREEEILNLLNNGKSIKEITLELEIDKRLVHKVTDKHKIQRVRFIFTIEQLLKIKELYNEKKTESEIAKHFNCGRYKISEELKKMNLK